MRIMNITESGHFQALEKHIFSIRTVAYSITHVNSIKASFVWMEAAIKELEELEASIKTLTSEELDEVTICSPNADFVGTNFAIYCSGAWTNHEARRFGGETLQECLDSAVKEKPK